MIEKIRDFISLLRPYQWHKNIFVFAPLFFSGDYPSEKIVKVSISFLAFLLISSSVYSLNDVIDSQRDAMHPVKRTRPVASGRISKRSAILFSVILLLLSSIISKSVGVISFVILYFVLNLIYSVFLKEQKPLDLFIVSAGFVIRVLAGGHAGGISPSSWLLISTFFIAMFISSIKRKAEVKFTKIYEHTSIISATLSIISYSMYVVIEKNSILLLLSIFPVMFGIVRYYIISEEKEHHDPSKLLLDRQIVVSVLAFLGIFAVELVLSKYKIKDFFGNF